jgi:PUA domain protein
MKSSAQRAIRQALAAAHPGIVPYIADILPKKEPVVGVRCRDRVQLVVVHNEPVLFNCGNGGSVWYPTLRLVHKYADVLALPRFQVDKGAISYLLGGAQVMCQGLTSAGGSLPEGADVPVGTCVAVYAEGKTHALAVATTLLSIKQIRETNKGPALDNLHYLGDALWSLKEL